MMIVEALVQSETGADVSSAERIVALTDESLDRVAGGAGSTVDPDGRAL